MTLRNKYLRKPAKFISKARLYIPFTEANKVWWHIDRQAKSILDIGCEKGGRMRFITGGRHFYSVGVDIWEPYLRECRQQRIHDEYVLCDVRQLPFARKSVDLVLCLEVIEHLEKEESLKLFAEIEAIAHKQVIISTPVGMYEQQALDGNPNQEHKSAWSPAELERMGYKVRGHGLLYWNRLAAHIPENIRPLAHIAVKMLASPLTYFFPSLGNDVVGIKNVKL